MKKIININLSGRVIPIEDSAYEKLQAYIESLRRYFANEDGRDEIINDIESRIAELMSEKVRKGAACVTDADINEIIASMGTPEEFDAAADEKTETAKPGNQQQQYSYTQNKFNGRGRLYRDTSDKFIGGVCSGIAAYMNVDPAIVRILFAIITFGGFGLGFLAYILLWIVLPPRDLEGYTGKRLYRNPGDKIFGGVASGLSAYFGKRTSTIRFLFAAPIVLSILLSVIDDYSWRFSFHFFPNLVFGSLSGTFILIYVVLWIVLPEANSNYEKMEMRGEKVDVNSIRQNVKEGMDNVKDRMKDWSEEVKESAQNISSKAREFSNTRGRAFASEVRDTARSSGRGIGHAIGVLFKVFFLFIAGSIALALFIAVIALIFGGVAWWPVNNFLWTSKWQQAYAWGTLLFFLGVPLVGFITWLIRRILGVRSRHSYLGWTFGFLWTLGWVAAILLASSISKDFWEYEHRDTPITVNQPANGKMIVAVSQPALEYTGRFEWINDGGEGWDLSTDTLKLSTVRFNIKASADSAYHVIVRKFGYGKTQEEALTRADKIQYAVYSRDSVLDLGNGYTIDKESKFRLQQVEIEIQIPVGKKIRFDESVNDKLNPVNFRVRRTIRRRRVVNIEIDDYHSTHFASGIDYTMTISGGLVDASGNAVGNSQNNENYRYDNNQDKKSTIEEQKRKVEEEQERLKKMEEEEKNKEKQKLKTSQRENTDNDDEDDTVADLSSVQGFSVLQWF